MDPVSLVLDALASGTARSSDDRAAAASARLRELVAALLAGDPGAHAAVLGQMPGPAAWRDSAGKALAATGAGTDEQVLAAAREVLGLTGLPGRGQAVLHGARGVQIGDGNYQVNLHVGALRGPPRPAAYLEQVRRIAPTDPPGLIDRQAETAELARFCLKPSAGAYTWWQGRAWAGKSALLSSFVLRPPAEVRGRVQIVSFFITARLAEQDTRRAFTEVMLEQLAGLVGQDVPAILPEALRDAYLLDLMSQAAAACAEADCLAGAGG